MCVLTSTLFLGGYLYDLTLFDNLIDYLYNSKVFNDLISHLYFSIFNDISDYFHYVTFLYKPLSSDKITYMIFLLNPLLKGMVYGLSLGLKSCVMVFVFIWARASLPRIRYDQLMSFCWTILLPLVIAFIILFPCVLYSFQIISANTSLL